MFVSIIFDVEYFGMGERHKWFLKNISYARQNDCLVITHEYIKKHYEEYARNCNPRFYEEFEMRRLSKEEYDNISKGFVEDKIFDDLEERFASRTEMLTYLMKKRDNALESALIDIIEKELGNRKDKKIDAIFNCLDSFASVLYLGEKYSCPVIPYVFSAIRKVHGYRETLYMSAMNGVLRQSKEIEERYQNYQVGKQVSIIFSNRELLAIFGKEKNLPLLKVIDCEPEHELGICKMASSILPCDYEKFKYTDTDLYYEARKKLDTTDIIIREHPNIPWIGNDRGVKKEHERNDPISFILSCKRIAGVDSQILLKALLWNRAAFTKGDFSPFQFMCLKDIRHLEKVNIHKLNYYIFAFLIPSRFMFDSEYWKWRLYQQPSEYDVYMKHLDYYINCFGYDKANLIKLEEEDRFKYLLESRNTDKSVIKEILSDEPLTRINYEVLYSKIVYKNANDIFKEITCINKQFENSICSRFIIENDIEIDDISYYPFVDVGGFWHMDKCKVDGKEISTDSKVQYIEKSNGGVKLDVETILPGKHEIIVIWNYFFK